MIPARDEDTADMGVVSTMYVSEGFGVGGGQDMCDAHKEDELVTGGQGKSTTIWDDMICMRLCGFMFHS